MRPATILIVIAHPDDAELTCGGTIARLTGAGSRAILILATDGELGGKEAGTVPSTVVQVRDEEQRRAAAALGIAEIVSLGFPDGRLEETPALRETLVEQIRRVRPDLAIFMDPLTVIYQNSYINHRDHRVLGMAMLDALYPQASNAGYFPEQLERGLEPHKVPEIWLAKSENPNHWVDVTQTLDRRFAALHYHESQLRLWPDAGKAIVEQQRAFAREIGAQHGYGYAEEFRRVVADPLS